MTTITAYPPTTVTQDVDVRTVTPHQAVINNFNASARPFSFDGGVGGYVGMTILAFLLTVFTLGFAYPWAVAMKYRWQANHTLVYGQRVRFTGTGGGLFGHWILWFLLSIVTLGIYALWVGPRLSKWIVEHQEFAS